ncbi:hypothetical protein GCM10027451_02720 [Geodermatophilus aquaeductus]|uniref:DUF6542 domain-containing protein n=1 Tax=Geodermatophilus aquaeductus TaxID=1564161 RepID=A0A521CHF6_9ACTN|nr:DUF6542 domain-containing protein [Geodermatophilus aquaeductus]SMO58897.1 hypothetical protein SAMN06273567_102403 [Geodermatophilus aquaeductus]
MASASTADTWRDSGVGGQRPYAVPRAARPDATGPDRSMRMGLPPVPPPPPRRSGGGGTGRSAGHGSGYGAGSAYGRPAEARPSARPAQARTPYPGVHPLAERGEAAAPARPRGGRPAGRAAERAAPQPAAGSRLRGVLAVLGVFVITLAGGAIDSFLGVGLGTLTLVTLVAATAVGTLLVRRRDLLTVVVSPPLVFVAVALVNIGLAPSASFTLPTLATVLIRGFPTMAVATGVALVLAIVRWAARR